MKLRFINLFFSCFLFFSCLSFPTFTYAGQLNLTDEEKAWIVENPTITLAVDDTYHPKNYRNKKGELEGISIDYMNLISKKAGISIKFEGDVWSKSIDKALKHQVDGIINADATKERKPYLNFTDVYTIYPQAVVAKKDFEHSGDFSSLKGKKVAVKRSTSQEALLKNKYPLIKIVSVETVLEGLTLLLEGHVDAVFDDISVLTYRIEENYFTDFKVLFLHYDDVIGKCRIGVRNDKPILHSILNKAISDITEIEHQIIKKKWSDFSTNQLSRELLIDLSQEEKEWLRQHPVIKVGAEANWAPVEFTGEDKKTQGLTSEYLKVIGESLGVKLDITNDVPWHELMRMARSGELDMLSGAAITEERKKFLKFTDEYISVPMVIFANEDVNYIADVSQLNGKKVAVGRDFAPHNLLSRDYPQIELVPCDTLQEAISKLSKHEVFALVDGILSVSYYMREMKISNLKIAGKTPYNYNIAMGVRKDWGILADIINRLVQNIPKHQKDGFYSKWAPIIYDYQKDWSYVWKIWIPFFCAMCFFFYWNRKMAKEIRKRKIAEADLAKAKDKVEVINTQLAEKFIERTGQWHEINDALREREELYRQIFEGSNDGIIFCDKEGFFLEANQSFLDMIGYTLEELKNKTFEDITPQHWNAVIKEEVLDKYLMVRGKTPRYEKEYIRKDGSVFPVEINAYKYETLGKHKFTLWAVIRDISDRKKTEKDLKDTADKLKAIFNQTFQFIGLLSPTGKILNANQRILDVLNEKEEEVIGKMLWDSFFWHNSEEMAAEVKKMIDDVARGERVRFQTDKFGSVGNGIILDTAISPMKNEKGEIIYLLTEGSDITDLKAAEKEAELQHKKLVQANRLSSLGTMIAGIAHEINNPVNFMSINTELLEQYFEKINTVLQNQDIERIFNFKRDKFDKNTAEIFKAVKDGTRRIKKIIYDLKEFSQYENAIVYDLFSLKETIEKAHRISLGLTKSLIENIEINIDDTMPDILGDCLKIEQVIVNMIVNAADALSARNNSFLRIDCFVCNNRSVRLIFADNGCGISSENIQKVFDPFVTTKQGKGGTGLGLSVSYGIIHEHQGSVFVYSKVNHGTCFVVDLPVDRKPIEKPEPKTLILSDITGSTDIVFLVENIECCEFVNIPSKISENYISDLLKQYAESDIVIFSGNNNLQLEFIENIIVKCFPWITLVCFGDGNGYESYNVSFYSDVHKLTETIVSLREKQLDSFIG